MNAAFEALGENAVLIRLGTRIDAALNADAIGLAQAIEAARLNGVLDVAPAYASVCVRYEPCAWADAGAPFERIAARLRDIVHNAANVSVRADEAALEIPVCYGGEFGPDLETLATHARLSVAETIARHCAGDYRVAMLGFAPGFPYLLGLDPALHAPRRASPRTRVPAGSVAIGGAQTGIYPRELPGGWHLIGRTPRALFDVARAAPALLSPGARVRFRAIGPDEFAACP